jgi:hypothetical protein
MQELPNPFVKGHRLDISGDFITFLSRLNSDWGRVRTAQLLWAHRSAATRTSAIRLDLAT